jgi:energy-coupling factor transporter transmembrane protein EcfT
LLNQSQNGLKHKHLSCHNSNWWWCMRLWCFSSLTIILRVPHHKILAWVPPLHLLLLFILMSPPKNHLFLDKKRGLVNLTT